MGHNGRAIRQGLALEGYVLTSDGKAKGEIVVLVKIGKAYYIYMEQSTLQRPQGLV